MSKSNYFILTAVLVICCASVVVGQDFGIRDTIRIIPAPLVVGESRPIDIWVANDNIIGGIALIFGVTSIDSGFARFDSIVFTGRMSDPTVLNQRIVNDKGADGVSPDTLVFGLLEFLGNRLAPGADVLARCYFTGLAPGALVLDTTTLASSGTYTGMVAGIAGGKTFRPEFVTGPVDVIVANLAPVMSVPGTVQAGVAGIPLVFSVSADSPRGWPVDVSLSSFRGYDDSTIAPNSSPAFDASVMEFTWSPSAGDRGVWRAVFTAVDSVGGTSSASVVVNVVSSANFSMNVLVTETPTTVRGTSLVHGDFDLDGKPELLLTGGGGEHTNSYASYDLNESGNLIEANPVYVAQVTRGAAVGFMNSDNHLDIVMQCFRSMLFLRGTGTNAFTSVPTTTPIDQNARGAVMTDFDGDAFLDYAIAGSSVYTPGGLLVFRGLADGTFDEAEFVQMEDTAISINTADFDRDGRDDLAIGTRKGLEIFLNDGNGGYSKAHQYSQPFGAVDIDVTNQGSDFNGDGYFDLCLATPSIGGSESELMLYLGHGDGSFSQSVIRRVLGQIPANCVADFNGDTHLDIAYVNSARKFLTVLFGDGTGQFSEERRWNVPNYFPAMIDALDIDSDGDMDIVVNSYLYGEGTSMHLFRNNFDPAAMRQVGLQIRAEDNLALELVAPSGAVLNSVKQSMPSASYYRRDLDGDSLLDVMAVINVVEPGPYRLIVRPRIDGAGTSGSLEYTLNGQLYRLLDNAAVPTDGYTFIIYPDGGSPVIPSCGDILHNGHPIFAWPAVGESQFQLASDPAFTNILFDTTLTGNTLALAEDLRAPDSTMFFWRTKSAETTDWEPIRSFALVLTPTDGDSPDATLPAAYSLSQNYPNPFNPQTSIKYSLARAGHVLIEVFDITGRKVTTLLNGNQSAGDHQVYWYGRDSDNRPVSSGVYYYRVLSGDFAATKKMVLIK